MPAWLNAPRDRPRAPSVSGGELLQVMRERGLRDVEQLMQLALADGAAGGLQEIEDLDPDRISEDLGGNRDRRGALAVGSLDPGWEAAGFLFDGRQNSRI